MTSTSNSVLELVGKAHPHFSLDYYRRIFTLLNLLEYRTGTKYFEESKLRNELELQSVSTNPYVKVFSRRAINNLKQVVEDLTSQELFIKTEFGLSKSQRFNEVREIITKLSNSDTRLVTWCASYLLSRNITNFRTQDIQNMISYAPEEIFSEILNQWQQQDGTYVPVLVRENDNLVIRKKIGLNNYTLLALDCNRKVALAIDNLFSSNRHVTEKEILRKVGELEQQRIDQILEKLKLGREKHQWIIGTEAKEELQLRLAICFWPQYGITYWKGGITRLRTRNVYVDMPNKTLNFFYYLAGEICSTYEWAFARMFRKARNMSDLRKKLESSKTFRALEQSVDVYNGMFNEEISRLLRTSRKSSPSWLKVSVKPNLLGSKWFILSYQVDWRAFLNFQDELANNDRTRLHQKYEFLANCRFDPARHFAGTDEMREIQQQVKIIASDYLSSSKEILSNLEENIRRIMPRIKGKSRKAHFQFLSSAYLPEMANTVHALSILSQNGAIPSCYREMRKIIEQLAWVAFDDLLSANTVGLANVDEMEFKRAYSRPNRNWFNWSKSTGMILRDSREFSSSIQTRLESEAIGKSELENMRKILFSSLDYSVLLGLTAKRIDGKLPDDVPTFDSQILKTLCEDNLNERLADFSESNGKRWAGIIAKGIPNDSKLVAPYPSNEFVLETIDTMTGNSLSKLYDEYSFFVHSYSESWNIFPFSSVLEFRIFEKELYRFASALNKTLDSVCNVRIPH